MPPSLFYNLLANRNWMELVGPLVLLAFYAGGAILKSIANRKPQKKTEGKEASPSRPRYKPLDQSAASRRAQTLPYARTVEQKERATSPPIETTRRPAEMTEWERQQQLKQRRRQQIEALRRQQLQQQQQQILRQQQLQTTAGRTERQPADGTRPTAFRKTPQEALRQVHTGRPSGPPSRSVAVKQPAATSVETAGKAQRKSAVRTPPASVSRTIRLTLRQRGSLRTAFVLKEILDTPLGLRDI